MASASDGSDTTLSKSIVILGVAHQIQGLEHYPRVGIKDDNYEALLGMLIKEKKIDLIFEEAASLGPSAADHVATRVGLPAPIDVDPGADKRRKLEIDVEVEPRFASQPELGIEPMYWHKLPGQWAREQMWIESIMRRDFERALLICGTNHMFSMALRLRQAGCDVEAGFYEPQRLIYEALKREGLV